MNKIERWVYDIVKHDMRVKNAVRNIYQLTFDCLPTPKSTSKFPIVERQGYFFGFHDHSPFSHNNELLLGCKYNIPLRMQQPGEELELGFFTGAKHTNFESVTSTKAWMWHMGCKLQWVGDSEAFAFNDYVGKESCSVVVNSSTAKRKEFEGHLSSISGDGRYAVGYSFERVRECMPGYGYVTDFKHSEHGKEQPESIGLHVIDLESEAHNLLFSIKDIAGYKPTESMNEAKHFISHAVFSPSSNRFIFLHRWIQGDDYSNRRTRMFSCDVEGKNLFLFPTGEMVSHIGWRGNSHVVAYCRSSSGIDGYMLFRDMDFYSAEGFGSHCFNSDGHPSFDPSGRWMITDTYPDRRRMQGLVLYDYEKQERINLARLHMPKKFQSKGAFYHWACDLHPRWDRKGEVVCFDATHNGRRSLCTMDISELTKGTR